MLSEACTLVLADMLYADGLIKFGVDRSCVDKRIYPLFECIKAVHNIDNPKQMDKAEKIEFIKKLLLANSHYALLGDDSKWKTLLTKQDGSINPEHLLCLNAYKEHFGKFFIGDNAWTRANFDNMQKQSGPLQKWINSVGKKQFTHANIPLLSEITQTVKKKDINHQDYAQVCMAVFNHVFEEKIGPYLNCDTFELENNETLQSRAFRRFLIGQVSINSDLKCSAKPAAFKWRHFHGEVILQCVRWCCKYGISYRDLEEMISERGLSRLHHALSLGLALCS